MALRIGFATEFYTLWDITTEKQYSQDENGNGVCTGIRTYYWFKGNVSKDLEKVKAKYPTLDIDYDLKGKNGSWEKFEKVDQYRDDEFGWGKVAGHSILESNSLWHLWTVYENHLNHRKENKRRAAYCRRRLIQLGELVSHVWFEMKDSGDLNWGKRDENGNCLPERHEDIQVRRKYISAKKLKSIQERERIEKMSGHFFNAGEKVVLEVKELNRFNFETQYGGGTIVIYETKCGKIVKYMGGSPLQLQTAEHASIDLEIENLKASTRRSLFQMDGSYSQLTPEDHDFNDKIWEERVRLEEKKKNITAEWYKVQGTVKHSVYRGVNETMLQRMKNVK